MNNNQRHTCKVVPGNITSWNGRC